MMSYSCGRPMGGRYQVMGDLWAIHGRPVNHHFLIPFVFRLTQGWSMGDPVDKHFKPMVDRREILGIVL